MQASSEAAFMQQFQPNINVCTVKQVSSGRLHGPTAMLQRAKGRWNTTARKLEAH
jgi:hypothetical protein